MYLTHYSGHSGAVKSRLSLNFVPETGAVFNVGPPSLREQGVHRPCRSSGYPHNSSYTNPRGCYATAVVFCLRLYLAIYHWLRVASHRLPECKVAGENVTRRFPTSLIWGPDDFKTYFNVDAVLASLSLNVGRRSHTDLPPLRCAPRSSVAPRESFVSRRD